MQNEYLKKQNDYFSSLFKKYGFSVNSLHWNSEGTQNKRFVELLKIFLLCDTAGTVRLLDFGCGLGHLYKFLHDYDIITSLKIDYVGADINDQFIKEAQRNFPDARFRIKDETVYDEEYGFVFCSGIFNLKFSEEFDIDRYYVEEISRLFKTAKYGVGVNFQSKEGLEMIPKKDLKKELKKFYFHDEAKVMENLKTITLNIRMSKGYLPNDFTVYLLHERDNYAKT